MHRELLPHREPFLFVREADEVVPGERASAWSNRPQDDLARFGYAGECVPLWYAAEFLAQTGALAVLASGRPGAKTLMTGLDEFRMLAPATVAEPLRAEVRLLGEKRGIGKRQGIVRQGETTVAEGVIWYARS